jgi:hypothetical protein
MLMEDHRLRVVMYYRLLADRVVWRIFGPLRDKVTGGWRRLLNEEH